MLQLAAARRNRCLRKIRLCRRVPLEIKATLEVLIDHLGSQTGYELAWPSASTIAARIGRTVRTVRWHLKAIRRTRIFSFERLSPMDAAAFCESRYGFSPRFDRCSRQAPTLYRVNAAHWLWSDATKVTPEQDEELGTTLAGVLVDRNRHKNRDTPAASTSRRLSGASGIATRSCSRHDLDDYRSSFAEIIGRLDSIEIHGVEVNADDVVDDILDHDVDDIPMDDVLFTQVCELQEVRQGVGSSLGSLLPHPTPLGCAQTFQPPVACPVLAVAGPTASSEPIPLDGSGPGGPSPSRSMGSIFSDFGKSWQGSGMKRLQGLLLPEQDPEDLDAGEFLEYADLLHDFLQD